MGSTPRTRKGGLLFPTEKDLPERDGTSECYSSVESIGHWQITTWPEVRVLRDTRDLPQRFKDSFMGRFFPVGYPQSVSEGYGTYSKYRAVQHFVGGILGVLSTQSLLFAAGLRPTPAQATIVSWVLKDGMAHVGKLVCSSLGARMDAEPKRWRIFADTMFDVGAGLEVLSPLCPQHFLAVAGLANLAKGMALVSARATRLPIYTSFAREGNLSDLYAKGEAISVLCNMGGLAVGIRLASSLCASAQGKLLAFPLLSGVHLYCVATEMRAAPVNTLNAQRTAMLVADYLTKDTVSFPGELRYRERLILPARLNHAAGDVRVGAPIRRALGHPSHLSKLKRQFQGERFLLSFKDHCTDLILHQNATGEDALRGWLLAACAAEIAEGRTAKGPAIEGGVGEQRGAGIESGVSEEHDREGRDEGAATITLAQGPMPPGEGRLEGDDHREGMSRSGITEEASCSSAGETPLLQSNQSMEGPPLKGLQEELAIARDGVDMFCSSTTMRAGGLGTVGQRWRGASREEMLGEAYQWMEKRLPAFLEGLREKGWHTQLFLEGSGVRAVW